MVKDLAGDSLKIRKINELIIGDVFQIVAWAVYTFIAPPLKAGAINEKDKWALAQ